MGAPGQVMARRASCHSCEACKSFDHQQECSHSERTGPWIQHTMTPLPKALTQVEEKARLAHALQLVDDSKVGACFAIEVSAARGKADVGHDFVNEEEKVAVAMANETMQTPYVLVKYCGGGVEELDGARHDMPTPLGVRKVGAACVTVQLYLPIAPGSNMYRLTDQTFPAPAHAIRKVVDLEESMAARRSARRLSPESRRFTISSSEKNSIMRLLA
jgi:hypothetical protein